MRENKGKGGLLYEDNNQKHRVKSKINYATNHIIEEHVQNFHLDDNYLHETT